MPEPSQVKEKIPSFWIVTFGLVQCCIGASTRKVSLEKVRCEGVVFLHRYGRVWRWIRLLSIVVRVDVGPYFLITIHIPTVVGTTLGTFLVDCPCSLGKSGVAFICDNRQVHKRKQIKSVGNEGTAKGVNLFYVMRS